MKSGYHVQLNETQEFAENKAETLKETDILIFGPKEFEERFVNYLTKREETPIAREYEYQTTRASDEGGPKIIAEQNASFCTLLLAFNEDGEGIIYHMPLTTLLEQYGHFPTNIEEDIDNIKNFARSTHGHLVITGTNISKEDQEVVLKALKLTEEDSTIPIFTSAQLTDRVSGWSDTLENNIQGICFVPKQLSQDGRNKIILLAQKINKGVFDEQLEPADFLEIPEPQEEDFPQLFNAEF